MSTLLTQLLTFLTSWNWYAIRAYRYQGVWHMSCLLSQFRKTVWGWSSLHTAEFMIIAIKVILSVCFYLNLPQNRIESSKLLSSFKLVFLLQATFSHPSVNPGVQSNLGFPDKGGVGGCHGTILFLTCPGFSSKPAACTTDVFAGCIGRFWWASAPKPAFLPVASVGAL